VHKKEKLESRRFFLGEDYSLTRLKKASNLEESNEYESDLRPYEHMVPISSFKVKEDRALLLKGALESEFISREKVLEREKYIDKLEGQNTNFSFNSTRYV
jgi:hypothetical protein